MSGSSTDDDGMKELFIESWPKKCGCGNVISEEDWERMHYVGVQKGVTQYSIPDLELRNCTGCGSTLAVAVPNDFA